MALFSDVPGAPTKRPVVLGIIILVLFVGCTVGAYWYGSTTGFDTGYKKAQADIKALQEQAAAKAAEDAAKSANPFQAVNPLEGVEANPFEKVKKVLNPFENE